ncbi:piggyBac transposable element-derived protein 4-like [Achroia grisella]|uniref:piggyBac transposable element-derived protein 4-like n=1 Tax=Achroia grisella TaxID=688607 RepID=UPI0027D2BA60|nr:piggyBac transposable element-derived protein 4-like [Achroia grisella]
MSNLNSVRRDGNSNEEMATQTLNALQMPTEESSSVILEVDDVTSRLVKCYSSSEGYSDFYEDEEDFGPGYMTLCEAANMVRLEILDEDDESDDEATKVSGLDENNDDKLSKVYSWTDDFNTFSSKKKTYMRSPGPTIYSQDPTELFTFIWDEAIVMLIVEETNMYAWQSIDTYAEIGKVPIYLQTWVDTTIDEMYRFLAILSLMGILYRPDIKEYWCTKGFGMPYIQSIMSLDRFRQMLKCIHFTDNYMLSPNLQSNSLKVAKIEPILQHCNDRFAALYVPRRVLKLEESLLSWNGRIKYDPEVCIKCLELREAKTGYLIRYKFQSFEPINVPHGFGDETANVVELMDGYLDVGHLLLVDNWYRQLSLMRYLKTRSTDVVGSIKRCRKELPVEVRKANKGIIRASPGQHISRHSGDISVTTSYNYGLLTLASTYHKNDFKRGQPAVVKTYKKYTLDTETEDQILSTNLFAKKRSQKWYFRAFRSLIHTSILNGYIIYSHNPISKRYLSQTDYFLGVCKGLLSKYPKPSAPSPVPSSVRLNQYNHSPKLSKHKSKELKCRRY